MVNAVEGSIDGKIRKINMQDDVFFDETVTTGPDGASAFLFKDETVLQLGPDSNLTLDAFVYEPGAQGGAQQMTMTLGAGAFRFVSGNMDKKAYTLKGPFGHIGVRGTSLFISVARNQVSRILVEEGALIVFNQDGKETVYPTDTVIEITKDGVVTSAVTLPPDLAALIAQMNTIMASAGAGIPHRIRLLPQLAGKTHDVYEEGCH